MISPQRSGLYKLVETRQDTKILYLDNDTFAWVKPANIGEMLLVSRKSHKSDQVLSLGRYHIYDVVDEPHLSDQKHLELETGKNMWQGYLLLSGLPDNHKIRGRIVPTDEIITGNRRYKGRKDLYYTLQNVLT